MNVQCQLTRSDKDDHWGVHQDTSAERQDAATELPPGERLAITYRRRKKDQLRQRLESRPADTRALQRLAELQAEMGEPEEFVTFARDLGRRHRCAWQGVCWVLQRLGRSREATDFLLDLHQACPGDAEVCCHLAKLQPDRSSHWLSQALRTDPNCPSALVALADEHRRAGHFDEAARLYEAAHGQAPLTARSLYRLGEALVQAGRGTEGRGYLALALQDSDGTFHFHAAVAIALSHVMDQQHERALEYCSAAEGLHGRLPRGGRGLHEIKLVRTLEGITHLRMGALDRSAETLRGAAGGAAADISALGGVGGSTPGRPSPERWDEILQSTLGVVETLRGDYGAAEKHLELARCLAGHSPGADVLVKTAYLRQSQGDWATAEALLWRALESDRDSPMALLRMGYILLCRGELGMAIQFLQKCLLQPSGTLAYGVAEKGMAHIYLCVAQHWRATGAEVGAGGMQDTTAGTVGCGSNGIGSGRGPPTVSSRAVAASPTASPGVPKHSVAVAAGASGAQPSEDRLAREHFRSGFALQPDFRRALAGLGPPESSTAEPASHEVGQRLLAGNPPRMGMVDLTPKQASVLFSYAKGCSLVPAGALCRVPSPPSAASSPLAATPGCAPAGLPAQPAQHMLGLPAAPPLVGTSSTAAPTSSGPSRNASDPALLLERPPPIGGSGPGREFKPACPSVSAAALELRDRLPPDKVLRFEDLDLGECLSWGESAIVHRGLLKSPRRDVVVKMLHQADCMYDEQAAAELLAEISMVSELRHPRLVTFVGACLEPSRISLVTELAPGGNLHHALHVRRRRLSRCEQLSLAVELLEGVHYLHARTPTVAHLDLKSMNLLLDAEGQHLQICDFGLARCIGGGGASLHERPPSCGGSPRYMAPECYDTGIGPVTEKADVWSSGCVLIEIFGACLPYAECSSVQQILKSMLVHRCGPSIPGPVEAPVRDAITAALAFEAHERPAVAQVLRQFETLLTAARGGAENKSPGHHVSPPAPRKFSLGMCAASGLRAPSRLMWFGS